MRKLPFFCNTHCQAVQAGRGILHTVPPFTEQLLRIRVPKIPHKKRRPVKIDQCSVSPTAEQHCTKTRRIQQTIETAYFADAFFFIRKYRRKQISRLDPGQCR